MKPNKKFIVPVIIISIILATSLFIYKKNTNENSTVDESNVTDVLQSKLVVTPEKENWGNIPLGSKAVSEIKIKNESEKEIQILKVTTSCSCTSAEFIDNEATPITLAPGETKLLKVIFDSEYHKDQPLGDITREVYIKTDSKEQEEIAVRFVGTVTQAQGNN